MFSPGIYNQQRSQYVGNTMGEMMNLLPFAQQRYDESRNLFDSMDSYIDNIPHLEGDREELEMTVAPFRQDVNEARESGDYRSLYDKANKLAKKMEQDRGIQTVQLSYQNMLKQQELESKLGSRGLTFTDPNKHKSITYDENGKANYKVYVPRVEERDDWDGKMVDIYGILKADGFSIDLRNHIGDIQGFLEHGKVSGISDPKVRKYLSDAYNRYIDSPEGVQDYERLRVIGNDQGSGPMEAEDAKADIEKRLLSVGTGMVYSDTSKSYQQNPYAQEAKANAQSEFDGFRNYSGADPSAGINFKRQILGTNRPLVYEDGKIKADFNWKASWQDYKENQKAIERTVPGGLSWLSRSLNDLETVINHVVKSATGSRSELKATPRQEILLNTIREQINPMSPESVGKEELVERINSVSNRPITFTPIVEPGVDKINEFNKKGINQVVDDPKEYQPGLMLNRKFYLDGQHVTYGTLTGSGGPIKNPVSSFVTGTFGSDNTFGFSGGGQMVNFTLENGESHTIPMQFSEELDQMPENQILNMIHETKISHLGMTYNNRNIGGVPAIMTNTGSKIHIWNPEDSQKPMVSADFSSQNFVEFANEVQGFRIIQGLPAYSDEQLQSVYLQFLIKKLNEK